MRSPRIPRKYAAVAVAAALALALAACGSSGPVEQQFIERQGHPHVLE